MVMTASAMVPLGTTAPDFTLPEPLTGQHKSLKDLKSDRGTVICFICNHCPFVMHIRDKLAQVAETYMERGFSFVGINANDPQAHPDDAPDKMIPLAKSLYPFPYLFDAEQNVAKAYGAACTPDFFVYNGRMQLVYRGQFDDARPGNQFKVTGMDLTKTLDALEAGSPISPIQNPSIGCNIKWHKEARDKA